MEEIALHLYTDGSAGRDRKVKDATGRGYPLGWGAVLGRGRISCSLSGRVLRDESCSTYAELLAIWLGLDGVAKKERARVRLALYCDNKGVRDALIGQADIKRYRHEVNRIKDRFKQFASVEVLMVRSGHGLNRRANTLAFRAMKGERGEG